MRHWVYCIILIVVFNRVFYCRKVIYMTDMCQNSSFVDLRLSFQQDSSYSVRLSKGIYPRGFNCCLNVSSDAAVEAEITAVKLRMEFFSRKCLESLVIITDRDQVDFCHEGDLTKRDPNQASYVVETKEKMILCFQSKLKEIDLEEDNYITDYEFFDYLSYGFVVKLLVFSYENDVKFCKNSLGGFLCTENSRRCFPKNIYCDGEEDCPLGEDENRSHCYHSVMEDAKDASTKEREAPLQHFLFIIIFLILVVVTGCLWYFLPKLNRFRRSNIVSDDIHESVSSFRDSRLLMSRLNAHESSRDGPTNITVVSVGNVQNSSLPPPSFDSIDFLVEQPPPSYDSLFGSRGGKTEEAKPDS